MTRIAVLGLGAMGFRIAQNLLDANYPLVVYNRTTHKVQPLVTQGAIYAPTPKEAAEQADIVISMLTDNEASRDVWLGPATGAIEGLREGAVAIASSTLTVDWTKELAATLKHRGAAFLDAPVVGSRPQADAGKLIYLVGGDAETLTRVQTVLQSTSGAIHHVGPIGQGMAMKLAVNALFGIQVAALAEVMGLLYQQGIPATKAMDCLGELPITSLAAKGAGGLMVEQQHAPMFPIELVEKDFRYAIAMSEADPPTTTAVREVYRDAIAKGHGQDNLSGVVQLFL